MRGTNGVGKNLIMSHRTPKGRVHGLATKVVDLTPQSLIRDRGSERGYDDAEELFVTAV